MADTMRKRMESERNVVLDRGPLKPKRRERAERDMIYALQTYFPNAFYNPFTKNQERLISEIESVVSQGRDKAIADVRGGGKTTIIQCSTMMLVNRGVVRYAVLIGATGDLADRLLDYIKIQYMTNELLWEDYPEICVPIRELERSPRRAQQQTVNGEFTDMIWSSGMLVLPTVKGSVASGAVIESRSLDGAVRGIKYGDQRPDLIIIDDPETRESVKSEDQINDKKIKINADLAGAGGPGKKLARLMAVTCMNRQSIAYTYTDAKLSPAWRPERYRLVEKFPDRQDLWQLYIDQFGEDPDKADEFYKSNYEDMNAGSVVSNPYYLKDGGLTAIQSYYNFVAKNGEEAASAELQNDPPESRRVNTSELTANSIANRLSGYEQRVVPPDAVRVTQFIDVQKYMLYWVVVAWTKDLKGYVIDYGVTEIHGPRDKPGVKSDPSNVITNTAHELACLRALRIRWQQIIENPYCKSDGEVVLIDMTLVDSGYALSQGAVYQFVRDTGGVRVKPSKGLAEHGHYQSPPLSKTRIPGEHYYQSIQKGGMWLVNMDTDYWRHRLHERWQTPMDQPGAIVVWGDTDQLDGLGKPQAARDHHSFAHHQVAEIWREKPFDEKKGVQGYWHKKSETNHWEDGMIGCCVAASMLGLTVIKRVILGDPKPVVTRKKRSGGNFALVGGRSW